jgi:AbrB family looped-hinge helix DNA binding protein
MRTKISTKGQVVLPSRIRRRLGLQPGDALDAGIEGERIVLVPRRPRRRRARIIEDRVTGLPVLTAGADAATVTSEQVREILTEFP